MTSRLLDYCRTNNWAGYDPYDVLNSRILKHLSFLDSRIPRLALTQLMKRSPLNLRPLLRVPKTQNPKAIALFLMALLKLSALGIIKELDSVSQMVQKLQALRAEDPAKKYWGYSFPWQTRTKIVSRGTPNLVCTVFVANALLSVYELNHDPYCLAMAVNASEFILNELYWTQGNSSSGFSYPLPSIREQIHNANFLGAALLCRVYHFTGEKKLLGPAFRVARCSASKQNDDGSWFYGESVKARWIDNFHTGYNLLGLRDINRYGKTTEFDSQIQRGFEFYIKHFFREDGVVRYFHNRTYPIDIHCVAQSLITLVTLKELDDNNLRLADRIFQWAINHMWNDHGYFYYQIQPLYKNRISYMRWSQAWMLLALSTVLGMPPQENWRAALR